MHILLGAVAGAGFAAIVVTGLALLRGEAPALKLVLLAALGGGVAGAITTATLGAGGMATVGIGRQVVAFGAAGAGGGAAERVVENHSAGRDITDGLPTAVGVGGSVGLASLGASRALQAGRARYFPSRKSKAPDSVFERLLETKTSGTGHGLRRTLQEEEPEEVSESPGGVRRRGVRHWESLRAWIREQRSRRGGNRPRRAAQSEAAGKPPRQPVLGGLSQALAPQQSACSSY